MSHPPRRVLVISATIGEGHNATARAVAEAAREGWPGCVVSWLDTLEVMGRWVPATFQWIYVTNVESTPWLYEFFYTALWRHRWFADGCRRFVGAWCGRRLRAPIARTRPDLVISTYPMGTAGLDWLRRRGELAIPLAAVVSDFAPHPFWVYPEIDLHYVMSTASVRAAHRAVPGAPADACAPPVVSAFRPRDKAAARRAFELPENGFTVLVSCGSMGFGSVERAVDAALDVVDVERVVVACARNEPLRDRLVARDDRRLIPLAWVDDMATLTSTADVVLTNAGGATALEALACGRTVVMFEPIAAHGRANAELMAHAGLAVLCRGPRDLRAALRQLSADPRELARTEEVALRHSQPGEFRHQVTALARLPGHAARQPLSTQDAFFVYAARDVPQQTGAVLHLDERARMSTSDWRAHLTGLVERRASSLPMLHHRFLARTGQRPVWTSSGEIEPRDHLRFREVRTGQWADALTEFFTEPLRTDRAPWELLLLRDVDANRTRLLAKTHHALGDGLAVTATLLDLLRDPESSAPPAPRRGSGRPWRRRAGAVLRGIADLAAAGTAPSTGMEGPSTPARRFGWVELPAVRVRSTAQRHGVSTSVLLLATIAEAVHRYLDGRAGTGDGQSFRAMVPKTARNTGRDSSFGNRTVALAVDLPVGPMPVDRRVSAVSERWARSKRTHQAEAAGIALAALGVLPAPLHAWTVRHVYQRRFFNAIVSVLPGPRQPPHIAGAEIAKVFPVLPLAWGVGLAVGAITWGEMVGFGVTADAGLVPAVDEFAEHLRGAFDDLQAVADSGR